MSTPKAKGKRRSSRHRESAIDVPPVPPPIDENLEGPASVAIPIVEDTATPVRDATDGDPHQTLSEVAPAAEAPRTPPQPEKISRSRALAQLRRGGKEGTRRKAEAVEMTKLPENNGLQTPPAPQSIAVAMENVGAIARDETPRTEAHEDHGVATSHSTSSLTNNEDGKRKGERAPSPPPPPQPATGGVVMPTAPRKRSKGGSSRRREESGERGAFDGVHSDDDDEKQYSDQENGEEGQEGSKKARGVGVAAPAPAVLTRFPADSVPRMLRLQRCFERTAPSLYDFLATHVLEWPTLAVEWIPDRIFEDPERDYTLQYVAVGTQTAPGVTNHVRIMEVAVPIVSHSDVMYNLYGDEDVGVSPSGPNPTYEDELAEMIDPGKLYKNVRGHFRCEQSLAVDAAVLKIRAMPAETNIIAVKTATGYVGVYNLVQDLREDEGGMTVPEVLLRGHKTGGFGLSWNTVKPGYIGSGSDDGFVNYWDVSHRLRIDLDEDGTHIPDMEGAETQPIQRLSGHADIVTDVSWHSSQGHLLVSGSMDGDVRIWDIRTTHTSTLMSQAHHGGVTGAQFHPVGAYQLATTGMDGVVSFWDIRRPNDELSSIGYHGKPITGLQWSPFSETVLGTYAEDGRVVLWDIGKTSLPLNYSQDGLAPPEVSFAHIGHLGRVTDFSWCPSKQSNWLAVSADTNNGIHFYQPKESVVLDYLTGN